MIDEPEPEEERRTHRPVFSCIASAARQHWTMLYKDYGIHHVSGRAVWAKARSVWAELSYQPGDRRILLRARLANLTGAITCRLVAQLAAIDVLHFGARIVWDPETGAVFAQASCRCPCGSREINDAVAFLFADFASLLGEERLLAVLTSAGALLCGTDLQQWDNEEDPLPGPRRTGKRFRRHP